MTGTIYLLHFDRPYRHAKHYTGWTGRRVRERFEDHVTGNGSPLVRAAIEAGIGVRVARTWRGSRRTERRIKNLKCAPRFCPICSPRNKRVTWAA